MTKESRKVKREESGRGDDEAVTFTITGTARHDHDGGDEPVVVEVSMKSGPMCTHEVCGMLASIAENIAESFNHDGDKDDRESYTATLLMLVSRAMAGLTVEQIDGLCATLREETHKLRISGVRPLRAGMIDTSQPTVDPGAFTILNKGNSTKH